MSEVACPDRSGRLGPEDRSCPFCGRTLAVRRCDGCGARCQVVALACHACGAVLPEKSAPGLADTTCPACDAPLGIQTVHDVRLHECGACGGAFFDREAFLRATDDTELRASLTFRGSTAGGPYRGSMPGRADPESAPTRERFYRRCPACRTVMSRVNFGRKSGVFLDVCPRHGTWLDRDELVAVLAFVEKGGLAEARAIEAKKLEEEAAAARQSRTAARISFAEDPPERDLAELRWLWHALLRLIGWRR